ncbi:MAG: hypothetical protein D6725_04340 [Planctomycetota bacterium]|nr:MAG: hypothetical protein D6725_04340 [Planctomycetota bacterium]
MAGAGMFFPGLTSLVVGAMTALAVYRAQDALDRAFRRSGGRPGPVTASLNLGHAVFAGVVAAALFLFAFGGVSLRARLPAALAFAAAGWVGALVFEQAGRWGLRADLWGAVKGAVPCGVVFALVYNLAFPSLAVRDVAATVVSVGTPDNLAEGIETVRTLLAYVDQLVCTVLGYVLGDALARLVTMVLSAHAIYGLAVIGPLCLTHSTAEQGPRY